MWSPSWMMAFKRFILASNRIKHRLEGSNPARNAKLQLKLDISLCKVIIWVLFVCHELAIFEGSATVSPSIDRKYHHIRSAIFCQYAAIPSPTPWKWLIHDKRNGALWYPYIRKCLILGSIFVLRSSCCLFRCSMSYEVKIILLKSYCYWIRSYY